MPFEGKKYRWVFFGSLIFLCSIPFPIFATPSKERTPAVSVVTSQATSMILKDDQFFFIGFGSSISRIDTETFDLTKDQVSALKDNSASGGKNLSGDVAGLAILGDQLFVTQGNGNLLTVDLTKITSDPISTNLVKGAVGPLVANTKAGSDRRLYILDKTNNAVLVYDVTSGTTTATIKLVDSLGVAVQPVSITYVSFPTDSSASTTSKIFVTSNRGLVFVILEGGTAVASTITLSTTNKDLPASAVTPGGNFLLVLNSTDTTVPVIDTATNTEIDTDPAAAGTNPISLAKNGSLSRIAITKVKNPDDLYAFVTGSAGVSVIDLNIGTTGFSPPTVIDPIKLVSTPGPIIASSVTDGFVYTSNSNATISVLSEKPFVTIGSTSLGSTALTTAKSFTITFQSDATGTYRVLAGGTFSGTGREVTTGTVPTAATNVTTASIAYDAAIFAEGTNRMFVFVTGSAGNIGRDAIDITVDTPPPAVELTSTSFGNEKVSVTFNRLTPSDMDHYNVYVDTDASIVKTKTAVGATVSQPATPAIGAQIEASVGGLTNGQTYFIAVEGVDKAGNVGPRTATLTGGAAASATPAKTVGLAGSTGERGCTLIAGDGEGSAGVLWVMIGLFILAGAGLCGPSLLRATTWGCPYKSIFFIIAILISLPAHATERTAQWWSLELKGGAWMPTNQTTKNFLGGCCEPMGAAEFGFLYKSRFGLEVGVGYLNPEGTGVAATTGAASSDAFGFLMIPIQNSLVFRADFIEDQVLVPYIKGGPDYVVFRENNQGVITRGLKTGLHAAGGVQILLSTLDDLSDLMEKDLGVNSVYLTLEGRYAWVNSLGSGGVNLSNWTFAGGLLFEF